MNPNKRQEIAQWRMSILGALVSARLGHGDRQALLQAAASRVYETPDGRRVRYEWRTLESWYYLYKARGLTALQPRQRKDAGVCRAIAAETAKYLLDLRREEPRRSVRTLIKAAKREKREGADALTGSSVIRLLRAHGLSQRPRATPERERRAFTVELPGDLWMGDAMHGPPVIDADGVVRKKAYLLSQIDVASRFILGSDFYLHEDAAHQEEGLRRAITGHGLPREYYVDGTTKQTPLEHFLAGCENLRPVPRDICLEDVFLHRESRKVRKDGTVRWGSVFLEVPGEYVDQKVDLRFAPLQPERPPMLYVDGKYVCDVFPLDRLANNKRPRRALPRPEPVPRRTGKSPLDLITDEYHALLRALGDEDSDAADDLEDDA